MMGFSKHFDYISKNTNDVFLSLDSKGKFVFLSASVKNFLGYNRKELVPNGFRKILTEESASKLIDLFENKNRILIEAGKSKDNLNFDLQFHTQSEQLVWGNLTIWIELTSSSKIKYIHGFIKDITKSKNDEQKLNKSKANLKAMFESSPQIYVLIDTQFRILSFNNHALQYYKKLYNKEIKQFKSILEFINPNRIESFKANFKESLAGNTVKLEREYNYDNYRQLWFELTYLPVYDTKKRIFAVAYSRLDITERKRSEEELKRSAKELKELNAMKDKFFSIIAHDLKNPFNNIIGFSRLLVNNLWEYELSKVQQFIELIYDSSKQGYALLENLLDWSRSQTGRLVFQQKNFDVYEIINEIIDQQKAFAVNKDVSIVNEVMTGTFVLADVEMLKTIFRNLISNAIKFSFTGGKVIIAAREERDFIRFSVEDSGVGMAEDDVKKLFRIDANHTTLGTHSEKGTGLGLLLCKEFVDKHHGYIKVESASGKGAKLIFTLPVGEKLMSE